MSIFVGPGDYAGGGGYGGGYAPARVGAYQPTGAVFGATMDPKTLAKQSVAELENELKEQQKIANLRSSNAAAKKDANANIAHINQALAAKQAPAAPAKPAAPPAPPKQAAAPAGNKPANSAGKTNDIKPANEPGVPRRDALAKEAEKAAVCDSSEVTAKLEADNNLISSLKDSVQAETNRASNIQAKVKELKAALSTAEESLKKARQDLGGKTGEHEGATAALAEAEANVRTCTTSIASVDANVGMLGSGLQTLKGEIEALAQKQEETLTLLAATDAAKP
jgi:hypothetical protein